MSSGRIPSIEGGIQPTIFDAKADILTATAADTPARLAVGTNGQYLQADSTTATGLKWATITAGGMTELASGSFTGVTSVTISSIPTTYKHLQLWIKDLDFVTDNRNINIRPNNVSTVSYLPISVGNENGAPYTAIGGDTAIVTQRNYSATPDDNFSVLSIYDYANTTTYRVYEMLSSLYSFGSNPCIEKLYGTFRQTGTAITQLNLISTGGNFAGNYVLYGVS